MTGEHDPDSRKPWLSTQVSLQWVAGLVLAFGVWGFQQYEDSENAMAGLAATMQERGQALAIITARLAALEAECRRRP